jgi:uncharacterized peroxidase-related enzyme
VAFLDTTEGDAGSEAAQRLREADHASAGYLPNYSVTFTMRPDVYAAWKALSAAVREPMGMYRYELATVAAASALGSSYCALAHGKVLAETFLSADEVARLVTDPSGLSPTDRAVMAYAHKVALHANQVTQDDIDELRGLGLRDAEIFDVACAAAMRCFFSKVLDATGTLPDAAFGELPPQLLRALTVGRPLDD